MPAEQPSTGRKRWRRYAVTSALLAVVAVFTVVVWNNYTLQRLVEDVIYSDPRNWGIEVSVYYEPFRNSIVYDLKSVSGDKSFADVFRVFLQFAAEIKDRKLEYVKLAYNGRVKYILPGEDFYSVGLMYSYGENPIYIIRTFPEKLLLPNGRHAFLKWEGGILAVTARQLEDFNTFMKTWLELR